MRLTAAHVRFWQSKRAPMPAIFSRLVRLPEVPGIDVLVNEHAGRDRFEYGDTHNQMNFIRRHSSLVVPQLEGMCRGCRFGDRNLTRWEANALKWLRRINQK